MFRVLFSLAWGHMVSKLSLQVTWDNVSKNGWVRTSRNSFSPLKTMRKLSILSESVFQNCGINQKFTAIQGMLFIKNGWILVRTVSLWHANLSYFHPPLPKSMVSWKSTTHSNDENLQPGRHWRGQNRVGAYSKTHSPRIITIWPVW